MVLLGGVPLKDSQQPNVKDAVTSQATLVVLLVRKGITLHASFSVHSTFFSESQEVGFSSPFLRAVSSFIMNQRVKMNHAYGHRPSHTKRFPPTERIFARFWIKGPSTICPERASHRPWWMFWW